MLARQVFFSFAAITDPTKHRAYNEWHQLDHRPENLALTGVVHGDRWVRTPACASAGRSSADLAATHYVNMYWFREPSAESFREWQGLAEQSYQWGRRPDVAFTTRPLMGLFDAVQGCAAARVRVSPDALPFRPIRGVAVIIHRLADPHSVATQDHYAVVGASVVPRLLTIPGVAGVWTFSSVSTTLDPSWRAVPGSTTFDPNGSDAGSLRVTLLYLDEHPLETWASIADDVVALGSLGVADEVFASALCPITAWEWDWFDDVDD